MFDKLQETEALKELLDKLVFEEYLSRFKDPDDADREWYKEIGQYR